MSDNFFTENTILVMIFFLLLVLFSFLKIGNCAYQLYSFKKSIVKGKKDILSVNQQIKLVPTDIQHTYNAITRIDNCLGIFILLVCAYNQLLIHHLFLSYIFMAIMGILACERWKFFLHLIEDGYLLIKKHWSIICTSFQV